MLNLINITQKQWWAEKYSGLWVFPSAKRKEYLFMEEVGLVEFSICDFGGVREKREER